jgi:hypothetical protein
MLLFMIDFGSSDVMLFSVTLSSLPITNADTKIPIEDQEHDLAAIKIIVVFGHSGSREYYKEIPYCVCLLSPSDKSR